MTDVLELELEADPGWYAVPEDADELHEWSIGLVRELAGPGAEEDAVRSAAESVFLHGRTQLEAGVEFAWVFLPEPLGPVVAVCSIELVFGTAGDLPSLDQVAETLARPEARYLDAPEVGRPLLQAGPAVRQHAVRTDGPEGSVVESVVHVLEVPGVDDALLRISAEWRALPLGEALVEQADRLAAALVVRTD
ncbi:hypothetical protein [Modestobacter altitudinis]|uniref:hypothetical protein n=1 Tax=Modestobacter altitudinis TaxID=2213158 RepID=UPI00110CF484|nr:hypothetical protein [Modestobacter altitudinis]